MATDINKNDDEESKTHSTITTVFSKQKDKFYDLQNTVREIVFPKAKFLRSCDLRYSKKSKSWCQKVAKNCHINDQNSVEWWDWAKREVLKEISRLRTIKTNKAREIFFSKLTNVYENNAT